MQKSKYDAIPDLLDRLGGSTVEVSLEDLDRTVGGLPPSAYKYQAWWANNFSRGTDSRQCRSWMERGWSAYPRLGEGKVLFRRNSGGGKHTENGKTKKVWPNQATSGTADDDERIRIEIVVAGEDVPLWIAFRGKGGNSSDLFSRALQDATERVVRGVAQL